METLTTEHGIFTSNEVTGQSAQEVYESWLFRDLQPSQSEIEDAEFEIKTLMLLMEMEAV